VDVSLEVLWHLSEYRSDDPVSILVLVDVSLEGPPGMALVPAPQVSILVLVDVSLEALGRVWKGSAPTMFQSLFSWMFRSKPAQFCLFSPEFRYTNPEFR